MELEQNVKKSKKSGGFQSFDLKPQVYNAVKKLYNLPTPIQRKTIPQILAGHDIVACSKTGSGKTAAFIIPLLNKLDQHSNVVGIRGLLILPTRELALQTASVIKNIGRFTNLTYVLMVGGHGFEGQFESLAQNPDILIATPGRLLQHLQEDRLKLGRLQMVIYDEADCLFDLGLADQVKGILKFLPNNRQSLIFSATIPEQLSQFASVGLKDYMYIKLDQEFQLPETMDVHFLLVSQENKISALLYLINSMMESVIVFVSTRYLVDQIAYILNKFDISAVHVYGKMDQYDRKLQLEQFKRQEAKVLVVTDLASRGIDIPFVQNVIHFDYPAKPKIFIHRSGRTARAGKKGSVYALTANDEIYFIQEIMLYTGRKLVCEGDLDDTTKAFYGCIPIDVLMQYQQQLELFKNDLEYEKLQEMSKNANLKFRKTRGTSQITKKKSKIDSHKIHPMFKRTQDDDTQEMLNQIKEYKSQNSYIEVKKIQEGDKNDPFLLAVHKLKKEQKYHQKQHSYENQQLQQQQQLKQNEKPQLRINQAQFVDNKFYVPAFKDPTRASEFDDLKKITVQDINQFALAEDNEGFGKRPQMKWDSNKKKYVKQKQSQDKEDKRMDPEKGKKQFKSWTRKNQIHLQQIGEEEDQQIVNRAKDIFQKRQMRGRGYYFNEQGGNNNAKNEIKNSDQLLKQKNKEESKIKEYEQIKEKLNREEIKEEMIAVKYFFNFFLYMKFKFFSSLCKIAHQEHEYIPAYLIEITIMIKIIQIVALLLPNDGWGLWTYKDNITYYVMRFSSAFLVTPYIQSLSIPIIIILLHLSSLICVFLIPYFRIINQKQVLLSLYYYMILQNNILMLPQLSFFINLLTCGQYSLRPFDSCNNMNILVGSIGAFLQISICLLAKYFLRQYSFMPFQSIQQKFSPFDIVQVLMNSSLILLHHVKQNDSINYLIITQIHSLLILEMKEIIYNQKFDIYLNQIYFNLLFVTETFCIVITLEVIGIYDEQYLATFSLVFCSISYCISKQYYDRYTITFNGYINFSNCVQYSQVLYYHQKLYKLGRMCHFLKLQQLQGIHKICRLGCLNQKTKFKDRVKQIIYCELSQQLDNVRYNQKIDYEDLQLAFISFLYQIYKKPLVSLIELKKFQQSNNSFYFKHISDYLNRHLFNLIQINQKNENESNQLLVSQITKSLNLERYYIPAFVHLLDMKVQLWTQQIKGYLDIYQLQDQACRLSRQVQSMNEHMNKDMNHLIESRDRSNNLIEYKLASIFYSSIKNDYSQSLYSETAIQDILSIEHTQSDDFFNNSKVIEEKFAYIKLSMVRHKGQIVNRNFKQNAQYFGYEDSDIMNIKMLMPKFIADVHDQLMNNYLQTQQSTLFDSFREVFGITKEGFIFSQQLKLDHDFSSQDDYQIIALLNKIKEGSHFILFNHDGRLLGITEQLFTDYFYEADNSFQIRQINQIFIYMLIPGIVEILDRALNNMENQEELTQIYISHNFKEQIQFFLDHAIVVPTRPQETSFKSIKSNNFLDQSIYTIKSENEQYIALSNTEYKNSINQYIKNFEDNFNNNRFIIRFNLRIKYLSLNQLNYFVLEILEIKKRNTFDNFDSSVGQSSNLQRNSSQPSQGFQQPFEQIDYAPQSEPIKEITPQSSQVYQVKFNYLKQLSNVGDSNIAPLSQRATFLSPTSRSNLHDQLIDKELIEHQNQTIQIALKGDQPSEIFQDNSKKFSSSQQKISNQILDILKSNKLNQQVEVQKSKSSITSGTSGLAAIQLIRTFQHSTRTTFNEKITIIIFQLILIMLIILISIHMNLINQINSQILGMIDDINGPLFLQRYIFQLFVYSWSITFDSFKLVDYSDYIINRILVSMTRLANIFYQQLSQMYPIYIDIEQRGLMPQIQIDLLYQRHIIVDYTYFYDFLIQLADYIFLTVNYSVRNITQLIDRKFIDNMLNLRYNLKNVASTNLDLIDSLNDIFFIKKDEINNQYYVQVIIEVIVVLLLVYSQIIFMRRTEIYCQKLSMLLGRLQESQANEMINKTLFIKEVLQTQFGKRSWKKQNFYQLCYESKIQQYQRVQTKQNDSKQINIVLSSRILRPQIRLHSALILLSIYFATITLFLFGGFILFSSQQAQLAPSFNLQLNFVKFGTQLNMVIASAYIIKTQPLLYNELQKKGIYSKSELDSFDDKNQIFQMFTSLYQSYDANITTIYQNIIISTKIDSTDKNLLLNIYSKSFCLSLKASLPFCQNLDSTTFYNKYMKSYPVDDNTGYISQGIEGIVSKITNFFQNSYQYEISNLDFDLDSQHVISLITSKEFINIIVEHFTDTVLGTNQFLLSIQSSVFKVMEQNLQSQQQYYLILGILLILIHVLSSTIWIYRTNKRLTQIRLSLINLPFEILVEPNTLSALKGMR